MTTEQAGLPVEVTTPPPTLPAPLLKQVQTDMLKAATVFLGEAEKYLKATIEKYQGVVWNDIHTVKGMDAITRARAEFRTFRTQLLKQGSDDLQAPGKAVKEVLTDHVRELGELAKAEEERLDAMIKAEEKRKADEKARKEAEERARVAGLRLRITAMTQLPVGLVSASSDAILDARDELLAQDLGDMQELKDEAESVRRDVATTLASMAADKMAAEEEAERQRLERERQAEAERNLAAQRAELARQQEQQKRLQDIISLPLTMSGAPLADLRRAFSRLQETVINAEGFGTMVDLAGDARARSASILWDMIAQAEKEEDERERQAAESRRQAEEAANQAAADAAMADAGAAETLPLLDDAPPAAPADLPEDDLLGNPLDDLEAPATSSSQAELEQGDHQLDAAVYSGALTQGAAFVRHTYYDDNADAMFPLHSEPVPVEQVTFLVTDAQLREAVAAYFLVSEEQAHARLLAYGAEGKSE